MQSHQHLQDKVYHSFSQSLENSVCNEKPYRHWFLSSVLPQACILELMSVKFSTSDYTAGSGARELSNDSRNYFDAANNRKYPVCAAISETFQSSDTVGKIEDFFDVTLEGASLRIEYAQDTDGFWLEPHTDIGVKLFTMLLYLSDDEGHESLGTDIYTNKNEYFGTSPFLPNHAMVFIPSNHSWHGFEKRPIKGVRKSIIINYVTPEWRSREQLAFPDHPVFS